MAVSRPISDPNVEVEFVIHNWNAAADVHAMVINHEAGQGKSNGINIAGLDDQSQSRPGWSKSSTNLQRYKHAI